MESDIYMKPTDQNQLFSFDSFHPPHVFRCIVRSQLCRVKRIVSDVTVRKIRLEEMCHKFREQGYPDNIIAQECRKLQQEEMKVTIGTQKHKERRLPFIFRFHSYSDDVFRVIKKQWTLLRQAYPQIEEFQQIPMKAYRRNKTLRDSLVRSEYRPREHHVKMTFLGKKRNGCFPCLNCIQCSLLMKGDHYIHPGNGERIMVKGFHTCQYSYII